MKACSSAIWRIRCQASSFSITCRRHQRASAHMAIAHIQLRPLCDEGLLLSNLAYPLPGELLLNDLQENMQFTSTITADVQADYIDNYD